MKNVKKKRHNEIINMFNMAELKGNESRERQTDTQQHQTKHYSDNKNCYRAEGGRNVEKNGRKIIRLA